MRKRRGRFARLVTVFLAMLVALGLTGMGYGIWSDTLNIDATVEMGSWEVELSEVTCSDNVTCSVDPADTLNIDITNASPDGDYYCDFDIHNTGTVPVKIQNITIPSLAGVTTTVSGVSVDDVIDGGGTVLGTVNMDVTTAGSYNVQVIIDTILWNE